MDDFSVGSISYAGFPERVARNKRARTRKRFYAVPMGRILIVILSLFSCGTFAGTLYTFDKNTVLFSAINHIYLRYSDLAKLELKPRYVEPALDKSGKLVVTVTLSYPADNEFGLLYVCAKIDENGTLVNIQRDISARKGVASILLPETPGCWGKP